MAGAVEALQAYLKSQGSTDWLAWEEAADLYLQMQVGKWCRGGGAWGLPCCLLAAQARRMALRSVAR